MSVYNGERFLSEAVESVLAQARCDFELVIVDDGSTDSSREILAAYAGRDSRVVVHSQPNQGLAMALNRGIGFARAPLVARLDADDVAQPGRLERQQQFLGEHEAVAVVGGAVTFMNASGRAFADWQYPLTDAEIRKALPRTTPFAHSAVMLRKDAFERSGEYRPLLTSALDVDLWLRIAERWELANLPEGVVSYRIHPGQMSVQHLERQTLESVAARASARARSEGIPDPLEMLERLDHDTLMAIGVSAEEVTSAFVHMSTWLAKTMHRAGYTGAAEEVFSEARRRARSATGSPALLAHVHRERARRYREQRRWIRAKLETIEAVRAERASRAVRRAPPV
jgi:Glycosyl transferase family 2